MGASQSELVAFKDPGPTVTEDRILRIVKTVEDTDDVVIEKITDESGTERGDGFASDIQDVRVVAKVHGIIRKYFWMIKSTPRTADRAVIMTKLKADEREVIFFKALLPQLKKFADSKGKSGLVPNFCHVPFAAWNDTDKALVMQNLKIEGYRDAINKKKGLDYHHVKLALKWLAEFHALGFAFLDQYKGGIEKAKEDLNIFFFKILQLPNADDLILAYDQYQDPITINLMEQVDEKFGGTKYVNTLKALFDKHGDLIRPALAAKENTDFKIHTICHSDPWFNNMMFRYDTQNCPLEVKFLDMQEVAVSGPVTDLIYFLYSSTTADFRRSSQETLLVFYHDTLVTNINQYGSIVDYTYEDLVKEMRLLGLWGLNTIVGMPDILANKEDMRDINEMFKVFANPHSEETKEILSKHEENKKVINNKTGLEERIKAIVDECIKNGLM